MISHMISHIRKSPQNRWICASCTIWLNFYFGIKKLRRDKWASVCVCVRSLPRLTRHMRPPPHSQCLWRQPIFLHAFWWVCSPENGFRKQPQVPPARFFSLDILLARSRENMREKKQGADIQDVCPVFIIFTIPERRHVTSFGVAFQRTSWVVYLDEFYKQKSSGVDKTDLILIEKMQKWFVVPWSSSKIKSPVLWVVKPVPQGCHVSMMSSFGQVGISLIFLKMTSKLAAFQCHLVT